MKGEKLHRGGAETPRRRGENLSGTALRELCASAPLRLAVAVFSLTTAIAQAQTFPNRPIRMVAGMPAGGGADLNARRLAEKLGKVLKQNVVVENIAGAAGSSAPVTVAGGNPDGHTILFTSHPVFAVNPILYDKLPFNPNDFQPVALVSQAPHVLLANLSLPATRVSDLITLAKNKPRAINFGSGGQGTSLHLSGELLNHLHKIELVHVPYRGAAPAIVALVSNEIQLLFDNSMSAIGQLRGGRVKALGIAAKARLPAIADVPTLDESGSPGFEASISHAVMVVNAVPKPTVAALNRAINTAVADADYKSAVAEYGVSLIGGTPEQLMKYLAAERAKFADIIKKRNVKVN